MTIQAKIPMSSMTTELSPAVPVQGSAFWVPNVKNPTRSEMPRVMK